jgi:nicotinamidase-related amidase
MTQALLLVDIQNDYFAGGTMELAGMDQAAHNASVVLKHFRKAQSPIIHITHRAARPGATFFLPNTYGAEIHESVTPEPGEPVLTKYYPNGFRDTSLLEILAKAGVTEVVICGAMSHMCIDATTRAAFDLGFRCTVIDDACATRHLDYKGVTVDAHDVHAAFMAALASVYATVLSVNEFIP